MYPSRSAFSPTSAGTQHITCTPESPGKRHPLGLLAPNQPQASPSPSSASSLITTTTTIIPITFIITITFTVTTIIVLCHGFTAVDHNQPASRCLHWCALQTPSGSLSPYGAEVAALLQYVDTQGASGIQGQSWAAALGKYFNDTYTGACMYAGGTPVHW